MFKPLRDWLDQRTGYRDLLAPWRQRVLPNGPSWALTSASVLFWLLIIEVVTGFLMMGTYTPSTTGAWASVLFIEQSWAGSFIRGVHYFTAHTMIVLFAVHVVRVLVAAAFRPPRELIWITGLLLMPLVIGWAMTGNPLTGSQKGMIQIEVEGNIMGATPLIGPLLQRLVIGGDEVGQVTLTHLYFLHVAAIPVLVTLLLVLHIQQVQRHALASEGVGWDQRSAGPPAVVPVEGSNINETTTSTELVGRRCAGPTLLPYFPYQTARNMFALTVVLGFISYLAIFWKAPLEAPADPTVPYSPRPEWYFRCLFELRHYFTGELEFVATHVVPAVALLVLLALPMFDRKLPGWPSRIARGAVVVIGLASLLGLTAVSYWRDIDDKEHIATNEQLDVISERIRHLATTQPLPPEGPLELLLNDPEIQGPILFKRHCVSCHSHADADGSGLVAETPSAPNLKGFGTTQWIAGLLDPERIKSDAYFGKTKMAEGDMVGAIAGHFDGIEGDDLTMLKKELAQVAVALSAEAGHMAAESGSSTADDIKAGVTLMTDKFGCCDCHHFRDKGELGSAPDLTGYGSREWLIGMIRNPLHERFYPEDHNDRMPAFAAEQGESSGNLMTQREVEIVADWLRGRTGNVELKPKSGAPATRTIATH